MPKIIAITRKVLDFLGYLARRFRDDNCLTAAAALSFTTILSLVPLVAIVLSILSAFPAFQNLVKRMQDFIFMNFVPASGEVIQDYIQQFADQASNLPGLGMVFLIITALLLMNTIDAALNQIWHVRRTRGLVSKFLVYWSVLTLGPILVATSIAATSYLVSLPFFAEGSTMGSVKATILTWMPLLSTSLALSMLYIIVPNLNVPIYAGLSAGVVAALMFEIAKKGFTIYVTSVPTYTTLYGALATIPIFLIWVYVSWIIVLLGAEISGSLATYGEYHDKLAR